MQEISLHADECKRLEESIESLRLEVRQLSTGRRSCVRRTVFPELYRVPTGRFYLAPTYTFHSTNCYLVAIIVIATDGFIDLLAVSVASHPTDFSFMPVGLGL